MIRRNGWRAALLGLALAAAAGPVLAQLQDDLLGLSDENRKAYLDPLQAGLSGTLHSAVFRSGYVPDHEVEVTFGVAVMAIGFDQDDRTYRPVDPPGFTSLEPTSVPTVIGALRGVVVTGEDQLARLYPGGFELDGFELAVPQATIGCLLGTRLLGRYFAVDLGDSDLGDFRYYGIGAQHSISQWIPSLPVDLAAGAFYQDFKISGNETESDSGNDFRARAKALQLNVTASRQFSILQPYAGVGYDSFRLTVDGTDRDEPENSFSVHFDRRTNAHLTLGLMARLHIAALYGEFNSGAGTGFALGLDFGTIGGAGHAVRYAR